MINPIQPNTQSTTIPMDTFSGQKMEQSQETPRPVVDRKQEIPSAREEIPREEVEKVAEKLNRLMGIIDKRLEFRVDEKSQRVVVKIIDQQNGELLDEIPSQRALDILNTFNDMVGLVFDKLI
ncbi:flagellar protein FlaG [Desulfosporosinus sp. BG]|uniref:flagellar protein FlaG n=1 Tax=Desulfosporosinus sp. BG TaxID=1633135 RepID=UPI0008551216|nr:flagellar protein FlaG [Desulfosporosinus sp. BG]ODA42527.1 Flagellar protein FlaG [Desulfosporosinus sp. BG]